MVEGPSSGGGDFEKRSGIGVLVCEESGWVVRAAEALPCRVIWLPFWRLHNAYIGQEKCLVFIYWVRQIPGYEILLNWLYLYYTTYQYNYNLKLGVPRYINLQFYPKYIYAQSNIFKIWNKICYVELTSSHWIFKLNLEIVKI